MPSDIRMAVQSSVSTYLWHFWQKITSSASSRSVFPGRSSELFVFMSPSIFYEFFISERTFIRGFVFARILRSAKVSVNL